MGKNKYQGTIVHLEAEKGYGFINIPEFSRNIFFHAKDLRHIQFSQIRKGDSVEVDNVEQTEKGYNAKGVYLTS